MHFYEMEVIPARCERKKRRQCRVRPLYAGKKTAGRKDKHGKVLSSEEEQNHRWIEHFREVLNQPDPPSFLNFDSYEVMQPLEVNIDEIGITEVLKAIKTLKNNKTPGIDNITPEVLKHGGPDMAQELCHLFNTFGILELVGKLFIDIADIYCFGTGLPISRSKHVFQYRHFK